MYRLLLSTTPLFACISGAVVTHRKLFSHMRHMPCQRSAASGCLRAARERLRGAGGRDGPQSSDARRGDPSGHPGEDPAGRSPEAYRRTGFRLILYRVATRVCAGVQEQSAGLEELAATKFVVAILLCNFRQFRCNVCACVMPSHFIVGVSFKLSRHVWTHRSRTRKRKDAQSYWFGSFFLPRYLHLFPIAQRTRPSLYLLDRLAEFLLDVSLPLPTPICWAQR